MEMTETTSKETEAKDTQAKDTEAKDADAKDTETKDTETKDTAVIKPAGIPGMKWYAIRTITGHEKRVKNYLDSEIAEVGLENKIAQVLIPEEKVFEVKGGKKKVKYKNFFPGYVLVEAVLDKDIINFLSHAPSVLKMVGDKNDAIALRDDEVNRILGRMSESDEKEKIDMQFEKGDLIKVVSGPFVNFNGTINEINLERMKVKVMVSIFGRKTPIELDFSQIEKEK
jgi:transcription termination/antitermination protein NusG